jgi:ketopantoate reductase
VQLARAGADVSLVARGAHLAAMRENGLKLLMDDKEFVVQPRCTELSMLQDLERGRPMEIDPLVTVVQEMGH